MWGILIIFIYTNPSCNKKNVTLRGVSFDIQSLTKVFIKPIIKTNVLIKIIYCVMNVQIKDLLIWFYRKNNININNTF